MKTSFRSCFFGALVLGTSSLFAGIQAGDQRPSDQPPMGLAKSEWQSIRTAYEAGRHAFQPVRGKDGQWQARNPGQQWNPTFDQRGFVAQPQGGGWSWGLELKSYGFGDGQELIHSTPVVKAEGLRLSYQWNDNVQEWFVNDQRGLEHGFTVAERPVAKNRSYGTYASYRTYFVADGLSFTLATRGTLRPAITPPAYSPWLRLR